MTIVSWVEPNAELCPAHTRAGIERYIFDGICPGDFLCAVLQNDLFRAMQHADAENIVSLHHIVALLYNYAPTESHGSTEAFERWLQLPADVREKRVARWREHPFFRKGAHAE